jgi:hypothetical protein
MEACAGAHFMGAALREQGHEVRLIPAQFVKPYRKSNKNDFLLALLTARYVRFFGSCGRLQSRRHGANDYNLRQKEKAFCIACNREFRRLKKSNIHHRQILPMN